jgi:hypothetical protein
MSPHGRSTGAIPPMGLTPSRDWKRLAIIVGVFEFMIVVLYGLFVEYPKKENEIQDSVQCKCV